MVKTEKNKTLDGSPQINDDKSFISFSFLTPITNKLITQMK